MSKKLITFLCVSVLVCILYMDMLVPNTDGIVEYVYAHVGASDMPNVPNENQSFRIIGVHDHVCKTRFAGALAHVPSSLIVPGLEFELTEISDLHGLASANKVVINCELSDIQLLHTLYHELGHVHYFQIEKNLPHNIFAKSTPVYNAHGIPNYLTEYATTNPHEDFAESFAMYFMNRSLFQEKAESSPTLQRKYDFIQTYVNSL